MERPMAMPAEQASNLLDQGVLRQQPRVQPPAQRFCGLLNEEELKKLQGIVEVEQLAKPEDQADGANIARSCLRGKCPWH